MRKYSFPSIFRVSASSAFIAGNLNLIFWGADLSLTGGLFLATSLSIMASAKNPKWLYASGGLLISAWASIWLNSSGDGAWLQEIAPFFGFAQGLLLLRSAYNLTHENALNFKGRIGKIFNVVDKYALASAGTIELPGALFVAAGAALSGNVPLLITGALWFLANSLLIASDPELYRKSTSAPTI